MAPFKSERPVLHHPEHNTMPSIVKWHSNTITTLLLDFICSLTTSWRENGLDNPRSTCCTPRPTPGSRVFPYIRASQILAYPEKRHMAVGSSL